MIIVKDVIFNYRTGVNEVTALKNINIDVKDDEFIAILGTNGSGKTTLAKNLNALLTPTKGEILIDNINTKEDPWEVRKKVGLVFQNPDNQIFCSTVEEEVAFGPQNLGLSEEEIKERVKNALEQVGMERFSKLNPYRLSSGEKQLLAIASIIAMKPKYVVLDEPTSFLDYFSKKKVIEVIKDLNENEHGVILFTHDISEILNSERTYVLHEGQIVMEGSPRYILKNADKIESIGIEVPHIIKLSNRIREYQNIGDIQQVVEELLWKDKA
ncbi:MAG: energy-coupling factor ABC transporter ATP-binding protein [Candidatus Hydrothermarchaeota archaeon]